MSNEASPNRKFRVLIAGGGVAAIETVLALRELAEDRVSITVLAPSDEFVYRPMSVREPFAYEAAARYPLQRILKGLDVELVKDKLVWVDRAERVAHTGSEAELGYDALMIALGSRLRSRYKHAITLDDGRIDEQLHGLIQDIECGFLKSIAFVAPGRMAWPLPLYELALMTAGRAYDMSVPLEVTIVTPEDRPLAIFGEAVSEGVAGLLAEKRIRTVTSAYAEIPCQGEIVINPGDRRLTANRVIALPELYGPAVGGLPLSEHGFLQVDKHSQMREAGPIFVAGDAVDFPVKQGGIGCQQADCAAEAIAALAGADVEPRPFRPDLHGMLLTDGEPRYLAAEIAGGFGSASRFSMTPLDGVTQKIAGKYLAPFLESLTTKVPS